MPTSTGFSWKKLGKEKIHDVALIELKKDAKLSPKVKIKKMHVFAGVAYLPSFCDKE